MHRRQKQRSWEGLEKQVRSRKPIRAPELVEEDKQYVVNGRDEEFENFNLFSNRNLKNSSTSSVKERS
ncbi:hypothetical protein K1719_042682 [Acacia pycnantha]|nr:hypothetical protein K1719_042682 [Acacia pycnantha]